MLGDAGRQISCAAGKGDPGKRPRKEVADRFGEDQHSGDSGDGELEREVMRGGGVEERTSRCRGEQGSQSIGAPAEHVGTESQAARDGGGQNAAGVGDEDARPLRAASAGENARQHRGGAGGHGGILPAPP